MANDEAKQEFMIFFSSPRWSLNGVNIFIQRLARGLDQLGWNVRIIVTNPHDKNTKTLPMPRDLSIASLQVSKGANWRERCQNLKEILIENTPCIYLPNHDFEHSVISSTLPDEVIIVGSLRSNEPRHYEHLERVGKYWNKTTTVSKRLLDRTKHKFPDLADRTTYISNGVPVPESPSIPDIENSPVKLIYTGRIQQKQKRVLDLIQLSQRLDKKNVSHRLELIGEGRDLEFIKQKFSDKINKGTIQLPGILSPRKVKNHLSSSHVFLLPSEYEGMSMSLLEAMSRGCVPLATDIESGTHQVIDNGNNGFLLPVGDVEAFTNKIVQLSKNPSQFQKLSRNAWRRVREKFHLTGMIEEYQQLFLQTIRELDAGEFQRPQEPIKSPPESWKRHLPDGIISAGQILKDFWRRYIKR